VRQNVPSTSNANLTYTVLVNGVATALAATVAGNAVTGGNTVDSIAVAADDAISIRVTRPADVSPSVQEIFVTVVFS
jgi:hypothetical protein